MINQKENYRIRFRMIDLIRKIEREKHVEEKVIKEQTTKLHSGNKNRSKNQFLITSSQLKIKDNAIWHYVKNRLTVRQWKWVYYFIVLDKSLKEIAEIENVTIEAVKGWAKETRNKLRKDPTFKTKLLKTIYKQ